MRCNHRCVDACRTSESDSIERLADAALNRHVVTLPWVTELTRTTSSRQADPRSDLLASSDSQTTQTEGSDMQRLKRMDRLYHPLRRARRSANTPGAVEGFQLLGAQHGYPI
jgi:hypothetical protein